MLFPEQTAPPSGKLVRLTGIAKMAAESALLEEKRRVEYRELPARSYISRCPNPELPFQWTINPYRGCEYGCKYCYARYTHEFMELRESESFETLIFAKTWNPRAFAEELRHIPYEQSIAIGTATDPYQPAERRFGLTRQMLEVIAAHAQHQGIWVTTKSDLVSRDADLFKEIARRGNEVSVNITITTLDRNLARAIEPYAPRPDLRLEAVRQLAAAGVFVCVNCSPLMPLINDSEANIQSVAEAAKQAGASAFWANLVFLKDSSKAAFLPFLQRNYPAAYRRYLHHFAKGAYLQGPYVELVRKRVLQAKECHGFTRSGSREGKRLPRVEGPQTGFQWE